MTLHYYPLLVWTEQSCKLYFSANDKCASGRWHWEGCHDNLLLRCHKLFFCGNDSCSFWIAMEEGRYEKWIIASGTQESLIRWEHRWKALHDVTICKVYKGGVKTVVQGQFIIFFCKKIAIFPHFFANRKLHCFLLRKLFHFCAAFCNSFILPKNGHIFFAQNFAMLKKLQPFS